VRGLWLFAFALGCQPAQVSPLPPSPGGAPDLSIYYSECTTVCRRPGDCAIAYPDGKICPPGFICGRLSTCDAGP
jgi:hypothetical protein